MKKSDTIFFVCGIISDKYGFECEGLYGRGLPSKFADIIDDGIPRNEFSAWSESSKYRTFTLPKHDGDKAVVYAEYRGINPNDSRVSRGTFIAVGCLLNAPFDPFAAVFAVQTIEMIHEDLARFRDSHNNSFARDFQLKNYNPPERIETDQSTQLANWLWQVVDSRGRSEVNQNSGLFTYEQILRILRDSHREYLEMPSDLKQEVLSGRSSIPNNQNSLLQFQQLIHVAKENMPQSRRSLNKLLKLEKERYQIIEYLAKSLKTIDQTPDVKTRNIPKGTQRGKPVRSSFTMNSTHGNRWLSWQTFVVSVTAVLICVTVAIAVFVIWTGS